MVQCLRALYTVRGNQDGSYKSNSTGRRISQGEIQPGDAVHGGAAQGEPGCCGITGAKASCGLSGRSCRKSRMPSSGTLRLTFPSCGNKAGEKIPGKRGCVQIEGGGKSGLIPVPGELGGEYHCDFHYSFLLQCGEKRGIMKEK